MNKDKAIQLLERLQDPEPYEPMLTKDAYDALQMAIDALSADDDTISRKAAIDALKQQAEAMSEWSNRYEEQRKGILTAVNIVEDLPPVQLGTDLASLGTDCISRQDALEAFGLSEKTRKYGGDHSGYDTMMMYEIQDTIENLPPIQPEIVRCKDCKHFIREDVEEYTPYGYDTHFHAFCDKHWDEEQGEYIDVNLDGYCSFAERREVTT